MTRPTPPTTRRSDHTDDYHGTPVPDPYRWLEDPGSPETQAWVEAQNAVTLPYLEGLPRRAALAERLTRLWDYPKLGVPWRRGERYFQFRNSGLQNQDVLYSAECLDGAWTPLLDPNTLSEDGTVALGGLSVSRDGQTLTYAVSRGGSDWIEWFVRDVETGEDGPDHIRHSKFSGAAWLPDGSGFIYGRYKAPAEGEALTGANYGQQLYLHRLGTGQDEDELLLARPDQPEWGFYARVSEDGRYLVVWVTHGTSPQNQLWLRPLAGGDWQELVGEFRALYNFIGNDGPEFYLVTDDGAPLGKLLRWNVETGERAELIPEGADTLEGAELVPDGLLVITQHDASHRLNLHGRGGAHIREIALPTLGSLAGLSARADDPEVFFGFTSFLFPATPYRLWLPDGQPEALDAPSPDFDPGSYETVQVFAESKDGTRVPMFLTYKRGLSLNGENAALLYGYGGFNISLTPSFSVSRLAWLELGGVLAVANLRGGGEYGEAWHEAGTKERKQNVFDDFIACAEYLIREGYTRPERLAIEGGSNGGLLVGACLTQRPELFGAAIPQVGVMDMLRFQKFTIGWAWTSDYGSSDDPEGFEYLHAYSPLHNLKPARYPATLITTGDHDDRVVPAHSYKFAAELQRAQQGDAPTLVRIQTRAGHGAGKPTRLIIEEQADIWAFLAQHLGLDD